MNSLYRAPSVARVARNFAVPLVVLATPAAAIAQDRDSLWLASKGFFERRADALLHLGRAEIAAQRATVFSRLLARASGLDARRTSNGEIELRLTRADGTAESCVADVYLNGSQVQRRLAAREVSLDQLIRVTDVTGLEVFEPGRSPVGGEDGCVSILVWNHLRADSRDPEFTGILRGRAARGSSGEPVAGIEVVLDPGGARQTTDSAGRFDFGSIRPARYHLTATAADGGSWTTEVHVRAFGAADVVLEVAPDQAPESGVVPSTHTGGRSRDRIITAPWDNRPAQWRPGAGPETGTWSRPLPDSTREQDRKPVPGPPGEEP